MKDARLADLLIAQGSPPVDSDEVAARLEMLGVTDVVAKERHDAPDVFALADRVLAAVAEDDASSRSRSGPTPLTVVPGATWRGLACLLPAAFVAAVAAAGIDGRPILLASTLGWGLAQALSILAYTLVKRGGAANPADSLGPLFVRSLLVVGLSVVVVALAAGAVAGLLVGATLGHLVASVLLLTLHRERLLLGLLALPAIASLAVALEAPLPPEVAVAAIAVAIIVELAFVALHTLFEVEPVDRGVTRADLLRTMPATSLGWATAIFCTLAAAPAFTEGASLGDTRVALVVALPYWVALAVAERFVVHLRHQIGSCLVRQGSLARYRRAAAVRATAAWLAVAASGLLLVAAVDLLVALPGDRSPVATATRFALLGAAVVAVLVLSVAHRLAWGLLVLVPASAALVVPAVADSTGLSLLVTAATATFLGITSGAALVDPATHR